MSTKKKTPKPKKVDVLKLSKSEKAHFLKEVKDNLRQKVVEAKFWRSLAGIKRVTINGYKIDFENGDLKGLTCDGLTTP